MNTIRSLAVVLIATFAATAQGQQSSTPPSTVPNPYTKEQDKKARFSEEEKTLQGQSRSSASGSARVDKSTAAADPIPKASTKQEKKERFKQQQQVLQNESRSSASGSARVDKSTPAAEPVSKATTKAEKKARFNNQEKALQRESTQ